MRLIWIAALVLIVKHSQAAPIDPPQFYAGRYADDHWAMWYPRRTDFDFIGIFRYRNTQVVAKLNPTDSRGYRAIVALVHPEMQTTFNRAYKVEEKIALHLGLMVVAEAYERIGLIAQVEILGNNAHALDETGCSVLLGSAREPLILHGHVIGRGVPDHEYVAGTKLLGLPPGEIFHHRGPKVPWRDDSMKAVSQIIANQIEAIYRTPGQPLRDLSIVDIR